MNIGVSGTTGASDGENERVQIVGAFGPRGSGKSWLVPTGGPGSNTPWEFASVVICLCGTLLVDILGKRWNRHAVKKTRLWLWRPWVAQVLVTAGGCDTACLMDIGPSSHAAGPDPECLWALG